MTPKEAKKGTEADWRNGGWKKEGERSYQGCKRWEAAVHWIDASDEYFLEKLAEVKQIADSVEQFALKEATEMLEKIPEASEADGSVAAPESASVAEASEASAKVT